MTSYNDENNKESNSYTGDEVSGVVDAVDTDDLDDNEEQIGGSLEPSEQSASVAPAESVNPTTSTAPTVLSEQLESAEPVVSKDESIKSKKNKSFTKVVVLALIVSLVGGGSIGAGIGLVNSFIDDGSQYSNNYYLEKNAESKSQITEIVSAEGSVYKTVVDIASDVGPSIVAIKSKVTVQDFFQTYQSEGQGSGVIFNINEESILILTNNHVIDDAEAVSVDIAKGLTVKATLVGVDPETDLAVIKVPKSEIPVEVMASIKPVVFGDSDDLQVGELAIALGNPLGYGNTLTVGVISALNRELTVSRKDFSLIQTDAAINPGNSGGALINSKGEVVGINTIKITDTQVEGIGFAIPINTAKPIIDQLLTKGFVSRPYLGVYGKDIDESLSELYELPLGVYVADVVQGSAASEAGIRQGDVIIEFDGEKIFSMEQLVDTINGHDVGDQIVVKVIREGKEKFEKNVILKEKMQVNQPKF